MTLYEQWQQMCNMAQTPQQLQEYWNSYFAMETENYKKMLDDVSIVHKGTLADLAKEFDMTDVVFTGFIDGINSSLSHEPYVLEELTPESEISLDIDLEKLFYNMVDCKANWLYNLPQWDNILTREKRDELIRAWRKSGQAVSQKTVGRNDPCPCGSGKKYKKCCGK